MTVNEALEQLIPGLVSIYGSFLDRVILYGSEARGTQTPESDVDIAIFLRAGTTKEMDDHMMDLIVDLGLACDRLLSPVNIDLAQFDEWKDILPFYQNIQKDGVILWQTA